MRMHPRDAGQGSLETTGVVVLAATLVTATVGTVAWRSGDIRASIASNVCRITTLGSDECADSGSSGSPETPSADAPENVVDDERTPLCTPSGSTRAGWPVSWAAELEGEFGIQLPSGATNWPVFSPSTGQWSMTAPPEGAGTLQGVTIVTGSLEVGESFPDAQGMNWSEVSYDVSVEAGLQYLNEGRIAGGYAAVEAEAVAGLGAGLSLTVPAAYAEGGIPSIGMASPLDPQSIPPGGTLTLDQEVYASAELEAEYNALVAGMQYSQGAGISVAITPLGDGEVQVSVGDTEAIEYASSLGLGSLDANVALTSDTRIEDFELQQYTIDFSTPEGQEAYYGLLTGTPPADGEPGISGPSVITGGEYSTARGAALAIGGLELSTSFYDGNTSSTVTEHPDGTTAVAMTQVLNGQVRTYVETFDTEGERVDLQTDIRLADLTGSDASGYNLHFAGDGREVGGPVNLVLDLDSDDLATIRQDAMTLALYGLNDTYAGQEIAAAQMGAGAAVTQDELEDWLAATDPAEVERIMTYALGGSGGDFPSVAMAQVLAGTAASGDDDWATYAAFTDALEIEGRASGQHLMNWGALMAEVTGEPYPGFGNATCTSVT